MWKVSTDHRSDPKSQICLFHDLTQAARSSTVFPSVTDCRSSITACALINDTSHLWILVFAVFVYHDLKNNYLIRKLNKYFPQTSHHPHLFVGFHSAFPACLLLGSLLVHNLTSVRSPVRKAQYFQVSSGFIPSFIYLPLSVQKVGENFSYSLIMFSSCIQLFPVNLNWLPV